MNRLASETSPYLLQHAGNPVDWYPWGPEALERARAEDRPILLSIGYAACHWCHVMEHESFEDPQTAALMNARFVNIKVDREERPDLDSIYMQAVQAMTGHGGWPMTVFLTPRGEPFYGGTYFPPTDRHGIPAFRRVLATIADAWRDSPAAIASTVAQVRAIYDAAARPTAGTDGAGTQHLDEAVRALARLYDAPRGGFGGAPKFPPSMALAFLVNRAARTGASQPLDMAARTFRAMVRGGIFDQVGGGLHRYSVDDRWLVPHFEKMLYDNALFLQCGVALWQAGRDPEVRRACEQVIGWLDREMTAPDGGFYSSLDADSEGHEGTFYVWDLAEFNELLGPDADLLRDYWGLTRGGNFEGRNIPFIADAEPPPGNLAFDPQHAATVERARACLYEARALRAWPARDEKVLASWNGLMLRALAMAARVLGNPRARALALANGAFLRAHMLHDGAVVRSFKDGSTKPWGFLEDHAAVALAFLELFTLTGDTTWLDDARAIAQSMHRRFLDDETGVFFDTPREHEALVTRPRDLTDNAMPAGSSLAAELLARLGVLDARQDLLDTATAQVSALSDALARHPSAFGHLLGVADLVVHGAVEVAVVGEQRDALLATVNATLVPSLVLAQVTADQAGHLALTRGKVPAAGQATAWVCRDAACAAPTTDPDELARQLRDSLPGRIG